MDKIYQNNEKVKQEFKEKYTILGDYDEEAYDIFKKNTKRILIAKYSDQKNVDALNKTQSLDVEVAIMLMKMAPSYDPETGNLTTLDNTVNQLIIEIPALKGTDIEKDPIRSGVLLLTEPSYTMQAKLILTKDGHIISFEEALIYDYKNEDVAKAQSLIEILDQAMDLKKVDHPDKKAQEFIDLIEKINNEKEILITN